MLRARVTDPAGMASIAPTALGSVELLHERIAQAVRERQDLRASAAGTAALERNRIEIAKLQQLLSLALIRRNAAAAA